MNPMLQRIGILFEQERYADAKNNLEDYLSEYPDSPIGQYYLAVACLHIDEKTKSRNIVDSLIEQFPDDPDYLMLSADIDLQDDYYQAAESKAELLIEMNPLDTDAHTLMSKIKIGQNNYDAALASADKALEMDAENLVARNLKIVISGFLRKSDVQSNIEEALQQDPNNAYTIANHGMQLVREGKIDEALERLKYALSLNPTNQMAQYGMQEALKSRFWLYRMFFKYKETMARLSGGSSWSFIIGAYIIYRGLSYLAANNPSLAPILYPIVVLIAILFVLSWVIDPLMNSYLLTNKFGRLLLDDDDKIMAKLVLGAVLAAIVLFGLYLLTSSSFILMISVVTALCMIPFGTFLNVTKPKNRKITKAFAIAPPALILISLIFQHEMFAAIAILVVIIYQWVINGMIIKENSRVFE